MCTKSGQKFSTMSTWRVPCSSMQLNYLLLLENRKCACEAATVATTTVMLQHFLSLTCLCGLRRNQKLSVENLSCISAKIFIVLCVSCWMAAFLTEMRGDLCEWATNFLYRVFWWQYATFNVLKGRRSKNVLETRENSTKWFAVFMRFQGFLVHSYMYVWFSDRIIYTVSHINFNYVKLQPASEIKFNLKFNEVFDD